MNLIGQFMNRRDIEASFVEFTKSVRDTDHGLLRSYMPHGREMLIVVGSEGVADILARKPYHFEKPDHIKFDLNFLFAKGLFTAEGAEHKVSCTSSTFPVHLMIVSLGTSQEPCTCLCLSPCEEPLPRLLVEES